jgi:hypothetical protein
MNRIHVILKPPRRVHDLCLFAKMIATRLSEDPLFSPPPALLAALEASVAAFEASLVASGSRTGGTAAQRWWRQRDVMSALESLRAYVQTLTNAQPLHEAEMVPARAGMSVKDAKGPKRGVLTVKQGRVSGSAHAYAPAARTRASYEWEYAPDGGAWISPPFTLHADVVLEGLAPGVLYFLRVRSVTKEGFGDWSERVSFRVT